MLRIFEERSSTAPMAMSAPRNAAAARRAESSRIAPCAAAMILLSSLLAGCVAAFAGPVSFVGIAVPFLVKRLLGTAKPILMIPACFLGGGVFCILSDILARTVVSPGELGISTVTAVLGAPVVLVIMLGRRGDRG